MAANLQPISSDGGFNSGGNININNGGNIVTAPEQDLSIIVQDSNDDGLVLSQVVTDGTDPQTSTELDVDAFSIYTDVSGDNNRWEFSGTTLQTPSNGSRIRAFDASVIIQSMYEGGNGTASLQSVSNVNDPNVYTTFDATPTGANIKVYNGGSNGGVEHAWQFDNDGVLTVAGNIIMADGATLKGTGASPAPNIYGFDSATFGGNLSVTGNITGGNIIGNGSNISNVAVKTAGSWTLASGVNTVSIGVPLNGTYAIWVNGNIPNGIITYTATAVVTNTNVPVLGEQYAWYYSVGNALVFTSIPDQFTGTVGSISNVNTYAGNTANVFTFGITNNSGNTAVVNYGYTKL
jgi:hypothetical protein